MDGEDEIVYDFLLLWFFWQMFDEDLKIVDKQIRKIQSQQDMFNNIPPSILFFF